jgi:hypothetical protein
MFFSFHSAAFRFFLEAFPRFSFCESAGNPSDMPSSRHGRPEGATMPEKDNFLDLFQGFPFIMRPSINTFHSD